MHSKGAVFTFYSSFNGANIFAFLFTPEIDF